MHRSLPIHTLKGTTPRPPDLIRPMNGGALPLVCFFDQQEPIFSLELTLGSGRYQQERPLTATLGLNMLREGTMHRNAEEFGRELDRLGLWLELEVGWHFSTVRVLGHTGVFEPSIPLLREIVLAPAFPRSELERLRVEYAQRMEVALKQNAVISEREFRACLFGLEHPYGQKPEPGQYKMLEEDMLREWYGGALKSPGMLLYTGPKSGPEHPDLERMGTELCTALSWNSPAPGIRAESPGKALGTLMKGGAGAALSLDGPGSHQASIEIGRILPPRTHEDSFGLHLLITILGGYFGSRLMASIREEGGLTYGIYAGIHHLLLGSYLRIHCETGPENVPEVYERVVRELECLQRTEVSPQELYKVKQYLMGESRFSLETILDHAQKYRALVNGAVSPDWYKGFLDYTERAEPSQIKVLAQKYLDPDSMIFLSCGTRQTKIF